MSDKLDKPIGPGIAFASEAAFLARLFRDNPIEAASIRRKYWKNALGMLEQFLKEKTPSAVGLQEINKTTPGSGTGSDAIDTMLAGTGYKQICENVKTHDAGLSIIYNEAKIGTVIGYSCIDNSTQPGRPLLMLLTKRDDGKQYLSISIHGAQDPTRRLNKASFNDYMVIANKEFLENNSVEFLNKNGVFGEDLAGIFIMGDFNDRYDAIKELNIGKAVVKYMGVAPKSCCYNWDSCCLPEDIEKAFDENYVTCKVPGEKLEDGSTVPGSVKDAAGMKISLGDRGNTSNYRYAGDKVFGINPTTEMIIFRPEGWAGISEQSDHELVYATVGERGIMGGGGRYRRKRATRRCKRTANYRRKSVRRPRRG